jgi:Tol biopolymer transport system component
VTELNDPVGIEGYLVLTGDELTAYFKSTRPLGNQSGDIWTASRTSTSSPFSNLKKVDELNDATAEDVPNWITPDGCRIYFYSERGGVLHVYQATKPK